VSWFTQLGQFFRKRVAQLRGWLTSCLESPHPRVHYQRVDEFPDDPIPYTLYVAGDEHCLWGAAMLCPCGCGDLIQLNLLKEASPYWSVRLSSDRSVSLFPSVWRSKGCRSHFFVRDGRVDWCRGTCQARVH
jgi:hypothetical protein